MSWDDSGYDEDSMTVSCRHCGAEIYEDAVVCPVCNEYPSTVGRSSAPLWFVITALVLLAALVLTLVFRV